VEAERAQCKTGIYSGSSRERKNEVFETDNVESKWTTMKKVGRRQQNKYVGGQKDRQGIMRHGGGMMITETGFFTGQMPFCHRANSVKA